MGLEFIGDLDPYAMIEVIGLALSSLNTISSQFLLDCLLYTSRCV